MSDNFRRFDVIDPFGRSWQVEFRWQQNAISIRHSDSVDCKFYISSGEESRELVVALPHPLLGAAAKARGREISDAWCLRLAGLHVRHMIATWDDMETSIATLQAADVERYSLAIEEADQAERERVAYSH